MSYYSNFILRSMVACWKEGRAIILQEKGRICMDSKMSKAVVYFSLKKSCMGWLGGHCFLEEFILLAHSLPFLFFPCLYKCHPTITTLPAGRHWGLELWTLTENKCHQWICAGRKWQWKQDSKKNQSGNRDEERISVGKEVRETSEAYGSPVPELKTLLQITLCKTCLHPSFCLNVAGSAKEI